MSRQKPKPKTKNFNPFKPATSEVGAPTQYHHGESDKRKNTKPERATDK